MVFFDITNKPLDLKGDELIESATKHFEEEDRKKQEEQEQALANFIDSDENVAPPPWPEPEPDVVRSGPLVYDEEQGSEFGSDPTASPISTCKMLDLLCDLGEEDETEQWEGSEHTVKSLAMGPLFDGFAEAFVAQADCVDAEGEVGTDLELNEAPSAGGPAGDDATGHVHAHPQALDDTESAARMARVMAWLEWDVPQARQKYEEAVAAIEAERDEIRERWALAMADGARYRAQEAERQAAADARAAEAAEQRRVQLVADAEAHWAALAAEEASTSITNSTAEHADNTDDVEVGDHEAVNDDEESDGDNGILRGLIDFNVPRLV